MGFTFSDQNFEREVLEAKLPVLVDFWALWCMPCRAIAPVVEELAKEFEGKIKVGKLNVDENPATAQKYGIMSIPSLAFFKNGVIVEQLIGVQPKQVLEEKIEYLLTSNRQKVSKEK